MRFSDRQHQGFGSCPFDESDESIDPTGFIANEMQFSDRQRIESSLFRWNLLDSIGHEGRLTMRSANNPDKLNSSFFLSMSLNGDSSFI